LIYHEILHQMEEERKEYIMVVEEKDIEEVKNAL
jgi:hypothetical protein